MEYAAPTARTGLLALIIQILRCHLNVSGLFGLLLNISDFSKQIYTKSYEKMLSHMCRACSTEFNDSSEVIPLFEPHKNIWYYRLINTTFRLSVSKVYSNHRFPSTLADGFSSFQYFQLTKKDTLSTNICKHCAIEILKSYKFRLKYIESDRKLRRMLDLVEEPNERRNSLDTVQTIDLAQTLISTSNTTGLTSRSQYPDHRRSNLSSEAIDTEDLLNSPSNSGRKRWKCSHCSAQFRTKKLKLKHEGERHPTNSLNEPSILIHDDDSDNDSFPNITEVNVDFDQNEMKFADQEPEMDLGLYLVQKHHQIGSFDPLEVNNASNLMLTSTNVGSHSTVKDLDDINNKWKCRVCSQKFRTRDLLREHNHLHVGVKMVPKPTIKVEKPIKVEKVNVVIEVEKNPNENSRWQCQTCCLKFETRELMRVHRRTHSFKKKPVGSEVKAVYVPKPVAEPVPCLKAIKVYNGPKKRKMEQQSDE